MVSEEVRFKSLSKDLLVSVILHLYHGKYGVTRNDDGFKGSHLHPLGRILKRTVGLSYYKHICGIVGPLHTKNIR